MERAFAPAEAAFREVVMQETWGHLAPKKNKTYEGRIVYAMGCYDSGELNPTVLVADFAGLSDSPWFYNALGDLLDELSWKPERAYPPRKGHGKVGCVYEWTGTFRNYKFEGTVRLLTDTNIRT